MADEPEFPLPQRGDIDWRLLAALLCHSIVTHICLNIVRVATSYRTVELGLPVIWLGVIAAAFAILPMFMAVGLGRFIDRGNDALAAWIGAAFILAGATGFWFYAGSGIALLGFTILLGTGHMFCMAAHQMLAVRSSNARGREAAFGHYMVAASIGQGLGPYIVGWVGGSSTVPPTEPLFSLGLLAAVACLAVALTLRPAPRKHGSATASEPMPVAALFRLPGMAAFILASVVTVTSLDLLVIYLPLLGAERHIDANAIGLLLAARSAAALVGRVFYARLIYAVGRTPLTLTTIFVGAAAFALLAVPSLPLMYVAVCVLGFALGIASTTTMTGIIALAPEDARATALSLRITGNRVGQVLLPFLAGVVAAATGVGGILVGISLSLAASGTAVHLSRRAR
jgi:MFS family permease